MADDTIPIQPSPCTYRHYHHLYFRPVITKRPSSPLLYSRHQIHLSQGAAKRRYDTRNVEAAGGVMLPLRFPRWDGRPPGGSLSPPYTLSLSLFLPSQYSQTRSFLFSTKTSPLFISSPPLFPSLLPTLFPISFPISQ